MSEMTVNSWQLLTGEKPESEALISSWDPLETEIQRRLTSDRQIGHHATAHHAPMDTGTDITMHTMNQAHNSENRSSGIHRHLTQAQRIFIQRHKIQAHTSTCIHAIRHTATQATCQTCIKTDMNTDLGTSRHTISVVFRHHKFHQIKWYTIVSTQEDICIHPI